MAPLQKKGKLNMRRKIVVMIPQMTAMMTAKTVTFNRALMGNNNMITRKAP